MSTFTYDCKKNGQSLSLVIESLPPVSLAYAINKGLREYFDNYHAEVTKLGITKQVKGQKVVTPWAVPGAFEATVKEYLTEAYDRLLAGDTASGRRESDPATVEARKRVAEMRQLGVTEAQWQRMKELIAKEEADAAKTAKKAA